MTGKSTNLTDSQNDLCYEIKFALVRGIINLENDVIWKYVTEGVIEMAKKAQKDKD